MHQSKLRFYLIQLGIFFRAKAHIMLSCNSPRLKLSLTGTVMWELGESQPWSQDFIFWVVNANNVFSFYQKIKQRDKERRERERECVCVFVCLYAILENMSIVFHSIMTKEILGTSILDWSNNYLTPLWCNFEAWHL